MVMRTLTKELHLWALCLLFFSFSFTTSYGDFESPAKYPDNPSYGDFESPANYLDNPSIAYTYNRFSEIEKHCGTVLRAASELELDDNRGGRIKNELLFTNGDWDQESGGAPLLPFDGRDKPNTFGDGDPLKLVSFWIMDVDTVRQAKNAVSVSSVMEIAISRSRSFSYNPFSNNRYEWSPRFYMEQGVSELTILFEGIYVESEENGGERLMCLLGNATMPASQFDDSMESMTEYGYNHNAKLHLVPDDQIMLVLRYPKTFTLTTRGISGEMKSLNQKWNLTYFDEVHLTSQLGCGSKYQFGSEEILSKASSPYSCQDNFVDEEVEMFKGEEFCEKLLDIAQNQIFDFVLSWKEGGANNQDHKLGPFVLGGKIEAADGDSNKLRLLVQALQCEPGNNLKEIRTTRVSAVFRLIHFHPAEYNYRQGERTGLSSTTLSAEGIWSSSDGQLCMVGCLGLVGAPSDRCVSRICLYLPLTFSMKQRSMMFGTISSISKKINMHSSLKFEKLMRPQQISEGYQWKYLWRNLKWSYNYSKIMQASEFQKRSKPSNLGTIFRKSFLWYPSLKGADIASLSHLADVLSLHHCAVPQNFASLQAPRTFVDIEVLSLGSLFGRHFGNPHEEKLEFEKHILSNAERLKISGQLRITGNNFYSVSLFFEGLYDPVVGQMYLIGCRDVRSSQKFIYNGTNLEGGMDCLIEIKIKYPPRNTQWLHNPEIKISINSKRSMEDPLYLFPITLNTFAVSCKKTSDHVDNVIFRKGFERVLRILMLTMAVLCTLSQSVYSKNEVHPTAYISLVMLGVQALGCCIPLINGTEVLFKWKEFKTNTRTCKEFEKLTWFQVLDSATKILLLVELLLIVKLCQKIWDSRSRLLARAHIPKTKIPNDKLVFLITSAIHTVGFSLFHIIHQVYTSQIVALFGNYYPRGDIKLLKWLGELEVYVGLVQDLVLLPQIAANTLWHIQGKPLRKSYYMGFTVVRLLLHTYEYIRDPISSVQGDEFQHLDLDSYIKIGNVIMGVFMLILAVIVYIQQKCNYQKYSLEVNAEDSEMLAPRSGLYESLLSE